MAAITNAIEKFLIGEYAPNKAPNKQDLTSVGSFLQNIISDATLVANIKEGKIESMNDNFHPYSAILRAAFVAFFVLWGINALNSRLPYQVQGMVKDVGTAAVLFPFFHLCSIAIKSIQEFAGGRPSVVENRPEDDCQ